MFMDLSSKPHFQTQSLDQGGKKKEEEEEDEEEENGT